MMPAYIKYQWKSQRASILRRPHHFRRLKLPLSANYLILHFDRLFLGALGRTSRYNNMDDMTKKKSTTLTIHDIYHHFRDCLIHLLVRSPLFRQLDLRNLHAELSLKLRRIKNRKNRRKRRRRKRKKKQDRTMKWFHLIYL